MRQDIIQTIAIINDMLAWVEQNKPDPYESQLLQLIEFRRRLMNMYMALDNNASIAIVGEVQSGKSYVVSSLLQDNNHPVRIKANDRDYDFQCEISPIACGHLSTGVIIRFTSYYSSPHRYNLNYPVVARLLSVTDIVLILCQSYYGSICDYSYPSEQAIEDKANLIFRTFHALPKQTEPLMRAEDILTIQTYFRKYLQFAPRKLTDRRPTSFFDKVAMVAECIPADKWLTSVFSILWDNNPEFDRLYTRLVTILSKLGFAKEIYMPIDAVLHHHVFNCDTILTYSDYHDLFNDNYNEVYVTDVYVYKGGDFKLLGTFSNNIVSAVCKEVVFKLEEENIYCEKQYCVEDITPEIQNLLNTDKFTADFLSHCDLLAFPRFYAVPSNYLRDLKKDDCIIASIYNKTKMQYLYNLYNEMCQIDALLFCHSHSHCSVPDLYVKLNNWIEGNIGRTPQERALTLSHTEGVSPLFIICTRFNIDMQESENAIANEQKALEWRWFWRFQSLLYCECLQANRVEWVRNWTRPGEFFKNSYLLRDFKFSGEKGSRLYFGFSTVGYEQGRIISKTFYDSLRESFCNNETTNMLFENPALSWDIAASRNNDGLLRIMEKLNELSLHLHKGREKKYAKQLDDLRSIIQKIQINMV